MPNIALIVAMRSEVPPILRKTAGTYQFGNNAVGLAVSGIGLKRARSAAQRVCSGTLGFQPDLLINSGFCGAVGKGLDVGHLIIADRLAHREREIQLKNWAVEKVADLLEKPEYHVGKLQTFNWPVLSRSRVPRGTLAVDMESFAIAQTAAKYRIPIVIIKAVSDVVPEHISLTGLLTLAGSFRVNAQKARDRLSAILKRFFEDQDLFNFISEI
jgi:adenosylhomocysteine nucleosidase